jgi:cation:H+ antiporter
MSGVGKIDTPAFGLGPPPRNQAGEANETFGPEYDLAEVSRVPATSRRVTRSPEMSTRHILYIVAAMAVALPALVVRALHLQVAPELSVVVFGSAVVAAAFLLAWAAEAAQVDISASLATACLALIAVLPEYAVDLYFSYTSGSRPEYAAYAAANMTGSNRLLLGLGWPVVALVFMLTMWRRGKPTTQLVLEPGRRIELGYLAVAGVYCFTIPLMGRISVIDSVVLLTLFVGYVVRASREERTEPELLGVAAGLGGLARRTRRPVVVGLFVTAALFVIVAAAPFADALVATGKRLGMDEFLLVQWLAPIASEAPEFIVAVLLALRGHGSLALGALLSSKVNQWTLLVGSIPLAHLAGGGGAGLPLDARQVEEFVLTASQTVLGFAVLANLSFSAIEALALLCLFALQFAFPGQHIRLAISGLYIVLAIILLVRHRASHVPILRAAWSTAYQKRPARG